MRKFTVVILSISLIFVFACAKKEEQKGAYLAKVGNVKITQADLEREIKNLPDFAQKIFEGGSGKERFLNELIKKELLYQEALKKGLDKNPEYLKKVEDFKKITLIGQLLEKELESKAKVSDQDVKAYYENHKEDFAPVNQLRLSLILVKTEEGATKIFEALKTGEDFAKVAKKSSTDPSAKNGGDLGYLARGQMATEIEAAAMKLKTGEISEPIKTKSGYEIIKVTDKKLGPVFEFDKVKNFIQQRLWAEKQKEAFDSYIDELKKSLKVEMNKDAIAKLASEKEGVQEKPGQMLEPKEAPKPAAKEAPVKKK